MYPLDSSHVWHVAKSGDNGNPGHAGQYPVNLANDAKLTISAAISAASDGDTIIIWPGTYDEKVDLNSANKGLILVGTHRDVCIIAPAADTAVLIEHDTQLHNLSIIGAASNKRGIDGNGKDNLIIDNCYCFGQYDGIYLANSENVRITNTYSKANFDGANIGNKGFFIDNCVFETDGGVTGSGVSALIIGTHTLEDRGTIIKNTIMKAVRTAASAEECWGFLCRKGSVILENCDIKAVTKSSATGDAKALRAGYSTSLSCELTIKNSILYSDSNGGDAYDIVALNDSKVAVLNSLYSRNKVSLTGSAKVADLLDAAKVFLNKAIQNKTTGAIDYYDDDGQTIILTHTPVDGESEITRTPS